MWIWCKLHGINILCDVYGFMIEDRGAVIFANSQDTSDFIKQRKLQWIKSYIGKHIEDIHNLETVFEVIATFFPSERKTFLLELIGYTKDIELPESVKLIVFICQSTIRLAKSRKCTLIMLNKPVLM